MDLDQLPCSCYTCIQPYRFIPSERGDLVKIHLIADLAPHVLLEILIPNKVNIHKVCVRKISPHISCTNGVKSWFQE